MAPFAAAARAAPSVLAVLAGLAAPGAAFESLRGVSTAASRIDPALEPASHKKFFERDYPTDPKLKESKHDFKYPFPHIQGPSTFEADYIKDENGDGGEWKAQMDYDMLRHRVREQQKVTQKASEKEQAEKNKYEEAHSEEKVAEEMAQKAKAKADAARKEYEGTSEVVTDLTGKDGTEGEVAEAVAGVEKEVKDLEKCKKNLADAREKLKRLVAEKAAREKAAAEAAEKDAAAAQRSNATAGGAKAAADAASQVKAEHGKALKDYKEEAADVAQAEAALKQAEERLKKARANGPQHEKRAAAKAAAERSGTRFAVSWPSTAALAALLICFLSAAAV